MNIKTLPSLGFAVPGKCLMSLLGMAILSLSANAAVLTVSFEAGEGFNAAETGPPSVNTGTPAAGWTFSTGTRIYASNAQALDGSLSLAINGGAQISATSPAFSAEPYTRTSWSFINPTTSYSPNANVGFAWIYLHDATTGSSHALKIYSRYGGSASTKLLLIVDGVNATQTFTISSAYNDWSQWNTVSFELNAGAKTYSLQINGNSVPALANLALPGDWNADSLNKITLLSPASGTTYYDSIIFQAVPEPAATWLIPLGIGVLGFQKRKRWLNLGGTKAA